MNHKEIIYVPVEKKPVFGFRTPEKPVECKDFYITCYTLNNLQPIGNPLLVMLWITFFLMFVVLVAAAIDIALFLIIKNLIVTVGKIISDSAMGIVGKAARIVGIAAGIFLVFVFIKSGVWEKYYAELLKVLGW